MLMNSTQTNVLRISTAAENLSGRNHIIRTSGEPVRKTAIYEQDLSLPRIKTTGGGESKRAV